MGTGFKHGAGGSNPLAFKVIAYATEEERSAATPKENTVGIITADKITSWAFAVTEPEAPEEGMVWFVTDKYSSGSFNALKKNDLQICPVFARQYIGGAWVEKSAKSWLDGSWVDWARYLYNNGDEINDLTGGWGYNKYHSSATLERKSDCIIAKTYHAQGSHLALGFVRTNKPIDLTDIQTISIEATVSTDSGISTFIAVLSADSNNAYDNAAVKASMPATAEKKVFSADVSQLTGKYYVGFGHNHGGNNAAVTVTMYECYLR